MPKLAFNSNDAAMRFGDFTGNGKAHAGALNALMVGAAAIELIENPALLELC